MRTWVISFLLRLPIVLLALSVHETAHGYVAYKLGDPTARSLGRLTLNPLKHLDPIGFLCMIIGGFGWANPVPVNARYFKKPRRDMALTALAGPASNLILALLFALGFNILALVFRSIEFTSDATAMIAFVTLAFFDLATYLNVALAVFNLIPIPPFDGSRFVFALLPPKIYFGMMKYERIIMIVLLALLLFGVLDKPLSLATNFVLNGVYGFWALFPFFR